MNGARYGSVVTEKQKQTKKKAVTCTTDYGGTITLLLAIAVIY